MFGKLRELRTTRNVPVETLTKLLGLQTVAAYYKKETGKVKFALSESKALADFFGLSVEEIFFENELSNMDNSP